MTRPLLALSFLAALALASKQPAWAAPPKTPGKAASKSALCFDGPPLVASLMWQHLAKFSGSPDFWDADRPLPSGTYGRCTVSDAQVFDAKGRRLARLHCGIEIQRRGLIDHLGLQVGARGSRVIERSRVKDRELVCSAYGRGSRCFFTSDAGHEPIAHYMVAKRLGDDVALRGAKAEAFFAPQRITRFVMRMTCH